jgi:hypothetical protein
MSMGEQHAYEQEMSKHVAECKYLGKSASNAKRSPRMYGHPADGSPKFVMCILDLGIAEDRAKIIWEQTAHLYIKKISHYTIER